MLIFIMLRVTRENQDWLAEIFNQRPFLPLNELN
jgi:hypothetical protein